MKSRFIQFQSFAYTYEANANGSLMETPPQLDLGQKVHFPIFHDETCVHANDLSNSVWMREGEQPLRNKSRGRIVHVSDFILEKDGRLSLTEEEIAAQMKLPARPAPPSQSLPTPTPTPLPTPGPLLTAKKGRKKTESNAPPKPATTRSFSELEDEWQPPPPPAPFTSYRINSFDARRIIHPGANYDPWWDMPQLIQQVSVSICLLS